MSLQLLKKIFPMPRNWIIVVLCCVIALGWWHTSNMAWVRTPAGNPVYVRSGSNADESAAFLDGIRRDVEAFIDKALHIHPADRRLLRIRRRWTGQISETEPHSKHIAYSLAKSDLKLCVRDPATKAIGERNAAIYVIIHELAHIACDEWGHTPKFWNTMKYLLELAEKVGVYKYQEEDASLCGSNLGPSPLTCVKRGTCPSELRPAQKP